MPGQVSRLARTPSRINESPYKITRCRFSFMTTTIAGRTGTYNGTSAKKMIVRGAPAD